MVLESSSRTEAAAPSGSSQQGTCKVEEIECPAPTETDPPPSIAVSADDNMCRPELSPLSSPEGFGELGTCERDGEWRGPGEKIDAGGVSGDDASPHCAWGATRDTDKATPLATAVVHHEGVKQAQEKDEGTERLPHDQTSAVALKVRCRPSGGGVEAMAASEQQAKARDQAKRLALEVARLRSSLRATTSELNRERSVRVRIEDEWWKKMGEWEEERGSLVAAKQEAEQLSRSADKELERVVAETKAREARAVSECVARETAQHKADSVMKNVLNVQDRLVQALQAEVTMTNRAREAAQDDARETKKQLRLYVQDFLLWRGRAKRLEARQKADNEAPTPPQLSEGDDAGPATTEEAGLAATAGPAEHAGHAQTGRNGEPAAESIPEKYARYFEADTGGYPVAPTDVARFGRPEAEHPKEGPEAMETDTAAAAAAWSTRLAMTGTSSISSAAHFQMSMKAQQAASARLEKDLMKARADLQSIYAGSRTPEAAGGGGGGGKAASAGSRPGAKEETLGTALPGGKTYDEVDGGEGEGSGGHQRPPESLTGEAKRGGSSSVLLNGAAGASVAKRAVEGSHLARVLAVLLGGDPVTAAGAAEGRASDAPSLSLRLADFPPALQAVFGEGPAVASPAAAALEHRAASSKGAPRARCGETRVRRQRQQNTRLRRESSVEINKREEVERAGTAAVAGRVRADGCGGRTEDRREELLRSAAGAWTVSAVAEGRESPSLTGAFLGYKAKSSLLRRWLDERDSPPLSQPDV